MRRPPLIPALAAVAAITVAGVSAWQLTPMPPARHQAYDNSASSLEPVEIGGAFEMTAHTGETVTDKTFEGKFLLVFFGYTFCPDICPTILNNVALALSELGDNAAAVQPLFITVDPARDTPEVLAGYLPAFHPSITGLTGTPEQTTSIAESYRAFFTKIEDDDNDPNTYLVGHTAYVYLMGRDGKFLTAFAYPANPNDMAAEITKYLKQEESAPDSSVPGDHVQGS
jgi:cytochrome oxidase Cu insertion factor (SCO1/SenC/PrrC family)